MLKTWVLILAVALGGISVANALVQGRATVVDGDTLEVQGVRIRLHGVDAVESAQQCRNKAGASYACGRQAANALSGWLGQRTVSCSRKDTDRYGRMVAECQVAGQSINAWLVNQGWAMAYVQYGGAVYLPLQNQAKAAGRGIWQGVFQAPWDYRRNPSNPPSAGTPRGESYFANCAAARAAGVAPIRRGEPGYRAALDRDNDGVACE